RRRFGLLSGLLSRLLNCVEITLRDVHIRYEDAHSIVGRPFCVGFTLEQLRVQTTDELFQTPSPFSPSKIVYKLISVDNLALYWNSRTAALQFGSNEE